MRVTLAQLNPTVGDIEGNLRRLTLACEQASRENSDLAIFPELFITGYPPRDLLERNWFIEKVNAAVGEIARLSTSWPGMGILFGAPMRTNECAGHCLTNSAVLVCEGKVVSRSDKSLLPTYDVFDEDRYFDRAKDIKPVEFKGEKLGIHVCEDAWNDKAFWPKPFYEIDPVEILASKGATIFINISASPFYIDKEELRFRMLHHHSIRHGIPFVFVNQVGANDELVFDGRSLALDSNGNAFLAAPPFTEHIETIETGTMGKPDLYQAENRIQAVHDALVLGIGDYMGKSGFKKAVVGLSGGVDSAVVIALASEAVGPENVLGVAMPSRYSKPESTSYAEKLAHELGIDFKIIPIDPIYQSYLDNLREPLEFGEKIEVTQENIQARIRGNILMAISNKFGHLVLSTGNKSELAVGYATLYGDMSGGLAVISDVPKTMVYGVARYMNREREIIPEWILTRPPSAELRPNQTDQDTLPPYDILDRIIHHYVDLNHSLEEIIDDGLPPETVKWVIRAIDRNEYKRRQAAPGLKITSKAFGMGRRMPIAAKYGG